MRRIINWFKNVRAGVILCRINKLENSILIVKQEVKDLGEYIKHLKKVRGYFEKEIRQVSKELENSKLRKEEKKIKKKYLSRGKKYLGRVTPILCDVEKTRTYRQKEIEELLTKIKELKGKYHGLDTKGFSGYTQSEIL